jgi:hypothetical protein
MRINPEIIKAIDALAAEQNRNRSNTIEWVLFEWFREHRPELTKPVIIDAVKIAGSERSTADEEVREAIELLALMPGEEVADAIEEVFHNAPPSGSPKKCRPRKPKTGEEIEP